MCFKSKILTTLFLSLLLSLPPLFGQTNGADFMQSIGKIYVVVAVIIAIFLGIIFYLTRLEKKIKNLEDQIQEQ